MLKQLTVRNFALVEALDIPFEPGLTVITGESGAGKSILVGALELVFGQRARVDLIRPGADTADVCAEFELAPDSKSAKALEALELTDGDQSQRVLLRRTVHREGRSRAFVNGVPVTLQQLRELTDGLVDVHGQDENVRLLRRDVQLELLDAYGVDRDLRAALREAWRDWQQARRDADALRASVSAIDDRSALLRYQLAELDQLALQGAGEFDELTGEAKRAAGAREIEATVRDVIAATEGLSDLRRGARKLGEIDDDHAVLAGAREGLGTALDLLDEAARDLDRYLGALDSDPERLAELEDRLDLIQTLARKHRVGPAQLFDQVATLTTELDGLNADQGRLEHLDQATRTLYGTFQGLAGKVSRARREAADGFASVVSAAMNTLGIRGGALAVTFEPAESEAGLETLEFQVTTNPKYPPGALARIASGGERARISLAIEVAAAARAELPCLVLDEADVGVGGTTADVLGRLLRDLGRHTQVLCITHAPQIAALGDQHLRVRKDVDQDVRIERLDDGRRLEEVARMLAGADVTDKTRTYAAALLDDAHATLH